MFTETEAWVAENALIINSTLVFERIIFFFFDSVVLYDGLPIKTYSVVNNNTTCSLEKTRKSNHG